MISGIDRIIERLCGLRIPHYSCDDSFYNCPAYSEDDPYKIGSIECDCLADKHNLELDAIIEELRHL